MFPPSQPEWKVFLLLLQHGFTDLNEMSLIRILLKPSMKLTLVHRKERLHEAINTCLFISEKKIFLQKVVSVVTQVLNQNDRSQQLCFVSDSFFIVCNSHRERGRKKWDSQWNVNFFTPFLSSFPQILRQHQSVQMTVFVEYHHNCFLFEGAMPNVYDQSVSRWDKEATLHLEEDLLLCFMSFYTVTVAILLHDSS